MWREFFYLNKSERRGVWTLILLILVLSAGGTMLIHAPESETQPDTDIFGEEYEEFIQSVRQRSPVYPKAKIVRQPKEKVRMTEFDPNTADSALLLQIGLPEWMAGNILKYRRKGGRFRRPEDFRKIYGLTESEYLRLKPYIRIVPLPETRRTTDTVWVSETVTPPDTAKMFKYPKGTVLDLNKADTAELKKIPGIGSYIARRIVQYRTQLGNYYRIEQLADIHLSVEKLRAWFKVSPGETKRMNLNRVSIERLMRHPYFNFYQAKAIVEYRKKKDDIRSLKQFELYEEFSAEDFQRMEPYVCFSE